ncbi:tryptophan synthase beta subunit-like PLP-dependent enzyme [Microdochium trichocladiopsis]|uniref:Cysteine synthase 2 n=1 Tax=Microdochium trichocladiopsis TaxID=1682393 RepID=A0A9P8Y597_9PEZI|nr:tryptophan synthase beta subunit-like PLP-dependent enzyme [Microdochium trichocladiopsis]KAH7027831.1 tryptophan synthase beta subunit-like PLP-dependent enzyme [Microdochium trichocladiopsis]
MSLSDHPRAYGTAAVAAAFAAGIVLTLGFKDLYPDLERRYQARRRKPPRGASSWSDLRRRSSLFWGPVQLEDHESDPDNDFTPAPSAQLGMVPGSVSGIEGAIGNTPLIEIRSLSLATGRVILAKAELLNAAGNSPKDRVALNMIREAEAAGLLLPHRGDTIYEGTVGSTGISLAALARAKGYRAHICMPDDQSMEKSDLLHHLGAIVERVPVAPITSPDHFVNLARRRAAEHTASQADSSVGFFADQFESPANFAAHFKTTGPEILAQTSGRIDAFVAGAGTGGTISGVAKYLKESAKLTNLKVVLADPQGSGLYNKIRYGVMYSNTEKEGTRRRSQVDSIVEGVGINRVTHNFESGRDLIDDAVKVTDEQACAMARWLVENDGIFVGSSSSVNCVAAVSTALSLPEGSRVVTVLCDSGTRHLSKFWKKVAEMGLEDQDQVDGQDIGVQILGKEDLISLLGLKSS